MSSSLPSSNSYERRWTDRCGSEMASPSPSLDELVQAVDGLREDIRGPDGLQPKLEAVRGDLKDLHEEADSIREYGETNRKLIGRQRLLIVAVTILLAAVRLIYARGIFTCQAG